jgi:hypothetical protein
VKWLAEKGILWGLFFTMQQVDDMIEHIDIVNKELHQKIKRKEIVYG